MLSNCKSKATRNQLLRPEPINSLDMSSKISSLLRESEPDIQKSPDSRLTMYLPLFYPNLLFVDSKQSLLVVPSGWLRVGPAGRFKQHCTYTQVKCASKNLIIFSVLFKKEYFEIPSTYCKFIEIDTKLHLHQTHIAPFCWFVQWRRVRLWQLTQLAKKTR